MRPKRMFSLIAITGVTLAFGATSPPKRPTRAECFRCPGMTWVETDCNVFYSGIFDSVEILDIRTLPEPLRGILNAHLNARLGRYASKLSFKRGYYVDVDSYFKRHPDENREPGWPYTYDLHFNIRLSDDGPVDYCAEIGLDQSGRVLQEINLPEFAKAPEKGSVLGASKLLQFAAALGVPVEKATLELRYDQKSDTLEYRVTFPGPDRSHDYFDRVDLYVTAHDASSYRWGRSRVYD